MTDRRRRIAALGVGLLAAPIVDRLSPPTISHKMREKLIEALLPWADWVIEVAGRPTENESGRPTEKKIDPYPPNPNLDAAAAMGGMGEEMIEHEQTASGEPIATQTCPVCHTPGGEHAEGCEICGKCEGMGAVNFDSEGADNCPDCSGAGRVLADHSLGEGGLIEDKEKE